MTVSFPVFFEVVGYQELKLPDDIDPSDEHSVKEFISDQWYDVPLPPMDEVEYVDGTCEFDWGAAVKIYDETEADEVTAEN